VLEVLLPRWRPLPRVISLSPFAVLYSVNCIALFSQCGDPLSSLMSLFGPPRFFFPSSRIGRTVGPSLFCLTLTRSLECFYLDDFLVVFPISSFPSDSFSLDTVIWIYPLLNLKRPSPDLVGFLPLFSPLPLPFFDFPHFVYTRPSTATCLPSDPLHRIRPPALCGVSHILHFPFANNPSQRPLSTKHCSVSLPPTISPPLVFLSPSRRMSVLLTRKEAPQ